MLRLLQLIFSKIMLLFGRISTEKAFEKPLSPEKEKYYFDKLRTGDKEAEQVLVKHNLRLVAHVAKKYKGTNDQDELISVGSVGLLKAIKSYNVQKGSSFSTYATRCIDNEILMMLRTDKKYANLVYLEDTISKDKDGNEITLIDILSDNSENMIEKIHSKLVFEKVLDIIEDKLTEREKKILFMRYGICGYNQYTQIEISKILNISRSYISRIEKHAIEVIRQNTKNNFYE